MLSAFAGDALVNDDYTLGTSVPVTFALSATDVTVSLTIVDDTDIEGDHQFTVQITGTSFGTIDASDTVTVTIKDNGKLQHV